MLFLSGILLVNFVNTAHCHDPDKYFTCVNDTSADYTYSTSSGWECTDMAQNVNHEGEDDVLHFRCQPDKNDNSNYYPPSTVNIFCEDDDLHLKYGDIYNNITTTESGKTTHVKKRSLHSVTGDQGEFNIHIYNSSGSNDHVAYFYGDSISSEYDSYMIQCHNQPNYNCDSDNQSCDVQIHVNYYGCKTKDLSTDPNIIFTKIG